jgi:hypothetical protein
MGLAFNFKSGYMHSVVDPDPHHFGNLDPHQIKIRIRIKVISWIGNWIRIRINFADVKPKCMEYETILALFLWFESLFGR